MSLAYPVYRLDWAFLVLQYCSIISFLFWKGLRMWPCPLPRHFPEAVINFAGWGRAENPPSPRRAERGGAGRGGEPPTPRRAGSPSLVFSLKKRCDCIRQPPPSWDKIPKIFLFPLIFARSENTCIPFVLFRMRGLTRVTSPVAKCKYIKLKVRLKQCFLKTQNKHFADWLSKWRLNRLIKIF